MKKQWRPVCNITDLVANSGVSALVNEGSQSEQQVAIFYIKGPEEAVYALSNHDPIGKANVLYRGLIGSSGDDVFVASPLYKQRFVLTDGRCLDDEAVSVPVYPVRIYDGIVELMC